MLESGVVKSLREIARRDSGQQLREPDGQLDDSAPDIVEAILDDTVPPDLTLFELAVDPPALWEEQRKRLDFVNMWLSTLIAGA